jgi:hypothetical protein
MGVSDHECDQLLETIVVDPAEFIACIQHGQETAEVIDA